MLVSITQLSAYLSASRSTDHKYHFAVLKRCMVSMICNVDKRNKNTN